MIGVWVLLRRRRAPEAVLEPVTVLGILMAGQGLVGTVQYELALPAQLVWVHVALATATWLTMLWAVAAAGRLVPRAAVVAEPERRATARELEAVGPTG